MFCDLLEGLIEGRNSYVMGRQHDRQQTLFYDF